MPQFDAGADTPVAASAVASGDKIVFVNVAGTAWETITAADLLDALLLVAETSSGRGLLKRVGNVLVVRQPGGTAGTDEVQISHDGTRALFDSKDGGVRLRGTTFEFVRSSDSSVILNYNGNDTLSLNGYFAPTRVYVPSLINVGPQDLTAVQIDRPTSHVLRIVRANGIAGATISSPPISPPQITADQHNYAPGVAMFYRLTSDASRAITGMSVGQVDGHRCQIRNCGSNNIVIAHQSASSTAANRFRNETGTGITIPPGGRVELVYDAIDSRWDVYPSKTCT